MSAKSEKNVKQSNSVHFTLQGKGGVGKTLVSSMVAQYFRSLDTGSVKCIDTDPVNQTFVKYRALEATHVNLLDGSKIDERNFDTLMEKLLSEDGIFVVDNGASSFVPLSNYLIENRAINMLQENGREVFIHCVINGGQSLVDTLAGFKALAEQTNSNNIIIWLNEFFGNIEQDGKTFTEMKAYLNHADKVRGIVRIVKRNQDTFGKDMQVMVTRSLTFNEAIEGPDFAIMAKQRLKTVQRDIYEQLDQVKF